MTPGDGLGILGGAIGPLQGRPDLGQRPLKFGDLGAVLVLGHAAVVDLLRAESPKWRSVTVVKNLVKVHHGSDHSRASPSGRALGATRPELLRISALRVTIPDATLA